jgi:hypothetical protein
MEGSLANAEKDGWESIMLITVAKGPEVNLLNHPVLQLARCPRTNSLIQIEAGVTLSRTVAMRTRRFRIVHCEYAITLALDDEDRLELPPTFTRNASALLGSQ